MSLIIHRSDFSIAKLSGKIVQAAEVAVMGWTDLGLAYTVWRVCVFACHKMLYFLYLLF